MDREVLIKVDHASKKFCKDLKRSLRYGFQDLGGMIFGGGRNDNHNLRKDEFWAVKDVSFEVRRGECLGLIGHNGAGKSTLLKMLNGLINPDGGSIEMKGKVGALIELGAGFNPILTGKENIYNSAAVYGFTKEETDAKLEDIIEFSELRDFLDMPVQNYSSGMKVRLGFAVAASMEPDILLVDEVLAVGDIGFRVKSMNRIQELLRNCAVIFVSHSMTQVANVCTQVILMGKGKIEFEGSEIGDGIERYFSSLRTNDTQIAISKGTTLRKITLSTNGRTCDTNETLSINSGDELEVQFEVQTPVDVKNLKFRVGIFSIEYRLLAEVDSLDSNFIVQNSQNGIVTISVKISNLYLRYGRYNLHVHVTDVEKEEKILRQSDVATFIVKQTTPIGADFLLPSKWNLLS